MHSSTLIHRRIDPEITRLAGEHRNDPRAVLEILRAQEEKLRLGRSDHEFL